MPDEFIDLSLSTRELKDISKRNINKPSIDDIHKALYELITSKNGDISYISIMNGSELELQIYRKTILLLRFPNYNDPGGPGELLRIRYKEGSLLHIIDRAANLLEGEEEEELIKLLKTLAKPDKE